jgi:hypothetical protein
MNKVIYICHHCKSVVDGPVRVEHTPTHTHFFHVKPDCKTAYERAKKWKRLTDELRSR